MRAGMGNLLETDSDVASVSDSSERERTDGDGMESENLLDVKNANTNSPLVEPPQSRKHPDKNIGGRENLNHNVPSDSQLSAVQPSTSGSSNTESCTDVSHGLSRNPSNKNITGNESLGKTKTVSPRELPPRSQLIQLKPTMNKAASTNSKNSLESTPEGMKKQKNPRFVPYEPYRGAVRPMVSQEEGSKKHSRTASEVSASSGSIEQVIGQISLNDSRVDEAAGCSIANHDNENTQQKSIDRRHSQFNNTTKIVENAQTSKHEKQTHAITLLKERLKIAEKDNDELHKENVRLKRMLVDSLAGDISQRTDTDHMNRDSAATNESVDALSNEIEVWRSKFLSSCVLVEQLTRENNVLNEAIGTASNIFKDIKLASTLSPDHFEEVNKWLKANRNSSSSLLHNDGAGDPNPIE